MEDISHGIETWVRSESRVMGHESWNSPCQMVIALTFESQPPLELIVPNGNVCVCVRVCAYVKSQCHFHLAQSIPKGADTQKKHPGRLQQYFNVTLYRAENSPLATVGKCKYIVLLIKNRALLIGYVDRI